MLANRKIAVHRGEARPATIVHAGTTVMTRPQDDHRAGVPDQLDQPGPAATGTDTMLAAAGPAAMTEVTRLTIQVPTNAVISQTGVVGRNATVTALQRGDQGDLGRHVAEHVHPGAGGAGPAAQPGQLTVRAVQRVRDLPTDQRDEADHPRPARAGGDRGGERDDRDRRAQPDHEVDQGQRGGRTPSR